MELSAVSVGEGSNGNAVRVGGECEYGSRVRLGRDLVRAEAGAGAGDLERSIRPETRSWRVGSLA